MGKFILAVFLTLLGFIVDIIEIIFTLLWELEIPKMWNEFKQDEDTLPVPWTEEVEYKGKPVYFKNVYYYIWNRKPIK